MKLTVACDLIAAVLQPTYSIESLDWRIEKRVPLLAQEWLYMCCGISNKL